MFGLDLSDRGCCFGGKLIQKLRQKGGLMKMKAFQECLHGLGEVIQFMHTYNGSCTSKDNEDPSGIQVSRPRGTHKTSSAFGSTLDVFIYVVFVTDRNFISCTVKESFMPPLNLLFHKPREERILAIKP
ncbi:hypothetical protein Tco_1220992 [Tanacetum coccineum]